MERICMTEDQTAYVDSQYREYEEGEEYEVPGWLGQSFKSKGVAVSAEGFNPTENRETKESVDQTDASEVETAGEDFTDVPDGVADVEVPEGSVTAEPTTEGSAWFQFRDQNGELIEGTDGKPAKVQGKDARQKALDYLNQ